MKTVNLFIFIIFAIAIAGFVWKLFIIEKHTAEAPAACSTEAKQCPDGSTVVRTGASCEFEACPPVPQTDDTGTGTRDTTVLNDQIRVSTPLPQEKVSSPLTVKGTARGTWFFEASFPVTIVDWDGRIIGEGVATAEGNWMTEDFVPYTALISFDLPSTTPYARGALILKKDNPSGLPEKDDALEIPITF